jgi:hypothetical protein
MEGIRSDGEAKLAELILYISHKCALDPKFGATKLNKILYFSDFIAYGEFGAAITGVEYCHRELGPAPTRLRPVRDDLERRNHLRVERRRLNSAREQHRTVALRDPDLAEFSGREIALVDDIIEQLRDDDAEQVSERSHQMVGWKITEMDQPIRYATIFLSDRPMSSGEKARALELVKVGRERGLPVG